MFKCEKCKITVTGHPPYCPLCQGELLSTGQEEDEIFPVLPHNSQVHRLFIRLVAFLTIAAAAVCIGVNLSLPGSGFWSLFVIAGIASFWLAVGFALKKRRNLPKAILWQVVLISLLSVVWDFSTGFKGWSIDYVLPLLYTCALAAMSVVARIMRLKIQDYILYLLLDALFAIIPLVFILCGALRIIYPSAICVAASMIFFAALILFEDAALQNELVRRFHL